MKKKTKVVLSVSVDKKVAEFIEETITNRSKYIEWLIYQDMMKNNVSTIKEVLI